jgi:hypothetical protein
MTTQPLGWFSRFTFLMNLLMTLVTHQNNVALLQLQSGILNHSYDMMGFQLSLQKMIATHHTTSFLFPVQ